MDFVITTDADCTVAVQKSDDDITWTDVTDKACNNTSTVIPITETTVYVRVSIKNNAATDATASIKCYAEA
jgi:hypothetical protein